MKRKYEVKININTVLFGNSVKHKATYVTEFEFDTRFENYERYETVWAKPGAAVQALNENWQDIIDKLTPFISRSLDSNSDRSIVERYNTKLLFNDTSTIEVTAI